jgi:hypothetical protein
VAAELDGGGGGGGGRLCALAPLSPNDFVSADAIDQLRATLSQEVRRGVVRVAEENRGRESHACRAVLSSAVVRRRLRELSPAAARWVGGDAALCVTSAVLALLRLVEPASSPTPSPAPSPCLDNQLDPAASPAPFLSSRPCLCQLTFCLLWFPCGLKTCKAAALSAGLAANQEPATMSCGVRSCRQCYLFQHETVPGWGVPCLQTRPLSLV